MTNEEQFLALQIKLVGRILNTFAGELRDANGGVWFCNAGLSLIKLTTGEKYALEMTLKTIREAEDKIKEMENRAPVNPVTVNQSKFN